MVNKTSRLQSTLLLSTLVVALVSLLEMSTIPIAIAQEGSPSDGRLLASNCFNCHGTDGNASSGFDSLAGESVSEIISEMQEMQVEDEGIMSVHARGFTDEEIRLIAEYLASR